MSNVETYEIDDRFDPLEDLSFEEPEEDRHEFLPPIPDAELSKVPAKVPLTVAEALDKMIEGMPGQRERILHALECCLEPKKLDEIVASMDETFPSAARISVYTSTLVVQHLEKTGAIATVAEEGSDGASSESEPEQDDGYLVVNAPAPLLYTATAEGIEALEALRDSDALNRIVHEEERYLPIYRRILEMASADGGSKTKDLDEAVDPDPLCEEPRRFCGYFLDRLKKAGAVYWQDAWITTDLGKQALASGLLDISEERS